MNPFQIALRMIMALLLLIVLFVSETTLHSDLSNITYRNRAHSGLLGNMLIKRELQEIPLDVLRFFITKNIKDNQWNFNANRTIRT